MRSALLEIIFNAMLLTVLRMPSNDQIIQANNLLDEKFFLHVRSRNLTEFFHRFIHRRTFGKLFRSTEHVLKQHQRYPKHHLYTYKKYIHNSHAMHISIIYHRTSDSPGFPLTLSTIQIYLLTYCKKSRGHFSVIL